MNDEIDQGDLYYQKEIKYKFPIKGKDLYNIVMDNLIQLFKDKWQDIYRGKITPYKVKNRGKIHTRKATNEDRIMRFDDMMSIKECINWILAHDFSPNTTAELIDNDKRYKLTINVIK